MNEILLQSATACLGSLGFALMFHVNRRQLFCAALNGLLTWICYLLVRGGGTEVFFPAVAASAFASIYAEAAARLRRAPANQFLVIGLIPLIPGASLYYAMSAAVAGEWVQAQSYANQTFHFALGIAIGISLVFALLELLLSLRKRLRAKRPSK